MELRSSSDSISGLEMSDSSSEMPPTQPLSDTDTDGKAEFGIPSENLIKKKVSTDDLISDLTSLSDLSLSEMTPAKRLFVTVGTTEFESLIKEMTREETLSTLAELGFTDIVLQIGRGEYEPSEIMNGPESKTPTLSYYRLKNSITEDIANADLVISHAGAGSVLDTLNAGKHLLVVVNDELMGNHQIELAEKLAEENYLHFCVVSDIVNCIRNLSWDSIVPFPTGQPEKFRGYLDEFFGFS